MKQSRIPAFGVFSVTAVVIAISVAATGIRCAGAHPDAASSRPSVIAANTAKSQPKGAPVLDKDPVQGSYSAESGMTVVQRDPKHPGVTLWTLVTKTSRFDHADQAVTGVLTGVSAQLYQNNKPAANMRAPRAVGDNVLKQITASGGVVVTSVNPVGRKLTADTVVWTAGTGSHSDKIVATGHVVYTDKTTGMTIHCPQLITDSHLKTVSSSNGDFDLNSATLKRK